MITYRGKIEWGFANNDVHSSTVRGPFAGDQQFVVQYEWDARSTITCRGPERSRLPGPVRVTGLADHQSEAGARA